MVVPEAALVVKRLMERLAELHVDRHVSAVVAPDEREVVSRADAVQLLQELVGHNVLFMPRARQRRPVNVAVVVPAREQFVEQREPAAFDRDAHSLAAPVSHFTSAHNVVQVCTVCKSKQDSNKSTVMSPSAADEQRL